MLSCAWQDIRRELGMEIIEEHTVMEYSKVMHPAILSSFLADFCMFKCYCFLTGQQEM